MHSEGGHKTLTTVDDQPEMLVSTGFNALLKATRSCLVPDKNRPWVALRVAGVVDDEEVSVGDDRDTLLPEHWETSATHVATRGCEDKGLNLHISKSSSCLWNTAVGLKSGRAEGKLNHH
jgi:hypothetical protein